MMRKIKVDQIIINPFFHMIMVMTMGISACSVGNDDNLPNTLTREEIRDGWKLLFDGETPSAWRGANKDKFPEKGWVIEDGTLIVLADGKGGDIVTKDKYSDFELSLDFMYEGNSNSGIKYFVLEDVYEPGQAMGPEYQLHYTGTNKLDDSNFQTMASLYDLLPAKNRELNAVGEWNNARIVSKGSTVEHWLNGRKVLEYERGGKEYREAVANSKFNKYKNYGEAPEGHILLQYHGDRMSFRNIKIRELN
jgi:hypothetical protein